ncbi:MULTISPECIES: four helix bundle protein [Chryseobacterium]|jgi:four helix bundle protein|uniref:Four helix bundle protein n=1 Tax=Chryseobacterium nepalense TaxID=1854498 RepID=A0ABY4KB77_9FLAO|nr:MULTISPECIES: four helix bundle protein [Chryseobacterium]MEC5173952.1 four helix bundle protein [Chryseobacterium nepalense]UPQ77038.1 four helix bundle protein [Chryseobacterium nepalense]
MKQNDLLARTFMFGVNCLKFLRTLPNDPESKLIRFQLGKSATSIGANYEESQAGSSKADFKNKVKIALREARESNFWLRILKNLDGYNSEEFQVLLNESAELKNILATIVNNTKL